MPVAPPPAKTPKPLSVRVAAPMTMLKDSPSKFAVVSSEAIVMIFPLNAPAPSVEPNVNSISRLNLPTSLTPSFCFKRLRHIRASSSVGNASLDNFAGAMLVWYPVAKSEITRLFTLMELTQRLLEI